MVVSRDWQEVSVLECILGGLQIDVDVESKPERAQAKLAKTKVDALIVDCDLSGTDRFLRNLEAVHPGVEHLLVSARTGEGVAAWRDWLARIARGAAVEAPA